MYVYVDCTYDHTCDVPKSCQKLPCKYGCRGFASNQRDNRDEKDKESDKAV